MNKSFIGLFELLKEMFSEGKTLSDRNYEVKKILFQLIFLCIKVNSCCIDCILYRKEYKKMNQYPECGESRYKGENIEQCFESHLKK